MPHPYREERSPIGLPPRVVPWALRIQLVFGSSPASLGWLLMAICSLSAWEFSVVRHNTTPAIFSAVLALLGVFLVAAGRAVGRDAIALLRSGRLALGQLTRKQDGEDGARELTFEFTADDGEQYLAVASVPRFSALEDEAKAQLLYNPGNPRQATLLHYLPGRPRVLPDGRLRARAFPALTCLFFPAATVAINLGFAVRALLGH